MNNVVWSPNTYPHAVWNNRWEVLELEALSLVIFVSTIHHSFRMQQSRCMTRITVSLMITPVHSKPERTLSTRHSAEYFIGWVSGGHWEDAWCFRLTSLCWDTPDLHWGDSTLVMVADTKVRITCSYHTDSIKSNVESIYSRYTRNILQLLNNLFFPGVRIQMVSLSSKCACSHGNNTRTI